MASDILGLFASPQQYEQQRQAAMEAQALQTARLSPMEQGQYGIALGAQQLGRAIGGALGGVDPQLQKITQRQQLLGMIDPNNPDSYAQAIQAALQTGDQEAAFLLRNEMMRVQEQASIAEGRRFEREKFLIDRGEGIRARNLQADALEKAKLLVREDGTVDQTVYADLINNYGQVGATVAKQRLDSMQGVKSMQAQQLAEGLFNPDGTRNLTIQNELSQTPQGREILKKLVPETKVFKRGDIITEINPVTGDYEIVTPAGLKQIPAGENPIKAMIDTKAIDKTVEPFAKEIAAQWDNLDDKGRADSLESLTKVNNTALDRNQRKAEAGAGGSDKVQSSKVTPDGTTILVMKNGTTRVISSEGIELKGKARTDAIKASEDYGADVQERRAQGRGIGDLDCKTSWSSICTDWQNQDKYWQH
jgi:hypothetical protein